MRALHVKHVPDDKPLQPLLGAIDHLARSWLTVNGLLLVPQQCLKGGIRKKQRLRLYRITTPGEGAVALA